MRGSSKISIIGAGFSGLVSAYACVKAGFEVEIFEASDRAGGLLGTRQREWGLVETAANAFVDSPALRELGRAIDLRWVEALPTSRKKYLYWNDSPSRWPLGVGETILSLPRLMLFRLKKPRPEELVAQWGRRALGSALTDRVLSPALQGVYAAGADELSASLVLSKFFHSEFSSSSEKTKTKSIAPLEGMGSFIEKLKIFLEAQGVKFHFQTRIEAHQLRDTSQRWVLATSASTAARLLSERDPKVSQSLSAVRMRGLVSATLHFPREEGTLEGFGILFPRPSGFTSLGVLFNSFIFEGRARGHSETWILGPRAVELSDSTLLALLLKERETLYSRPMRAPLNHSITRWSEALPLYDIKLERFLRSGAVERLSSAGIDLIGNYLGDLSLTRILERALRLPQKLKGE